MDQIDYAEERHQNQQQLIARLQQRVETQAYELQEQAHRIQQLEAQLAETQAKISQGPQFDEKVVYLRNELLQIIEKQYNRRQESLKEAGHALTAQLDNHTKAISDLRRDLDKTHRYDEQIMLTRTELERVNKGVTTFEARLDELKKQLDERLRTLSYLEEHRRTDTRRIAELQAELPEIQKKIETNLAKVRVVEQQVPQFGKYELALEEVREEIRRHREHMDFQIAQRERQMKDWTQFAEAQERRMDEYTGLMEKYAEHYQLNKRALEALQELQERIQREQHQSGELQRLAERRLQAEMEKWQVDYEQRWKKQSIEWTPHFTEMQRNMELLQKRMDEAIKLHKTLEKQMDMILQIIEEDVQARSAAAGDWLQRFEEIANGQG